MCHAFIYRLGLHLLRKNADLPRQQWNLAASARFVLLHPRLVAASDCCCSSCFARFNPGQESRATPTGPTSPPDARSNKARERIGRALLRLQASCHLRRGVVRRLSVYCGKQDSQLPASQPSNGQRHRRLLVTHTHTHTSDPVKVVA